MTTQRTSPKRIVVLISGKGTNLQALMDATHQGQINGAVVAVISNRPRAFGLVRAKDAQIPAEVVSFAPFKTHPDGRSAYDEALAMRVQSYAPDLIILAGFMRILTTDFVRALRGTMLNVHPSLLPKYTGLKTHQRALDAGETTHGVSIHFVTEELDGGPVIAQAEVSISPDDPPESLAEKVQEKEHVLYPIVVRWFCEGRIQLGTDYVVFDGQPLNRPVVLPDENSAASA